MFRLILIATVLSAVASSVSGAGYSIVYQQPTGGAQVGGVWLERYNDLFQGNPRSLAYKKDQGDLANDLGAVCQGDFTSWASKGNSSPGVWSFNCVNSVTDITANVNTIGYRVGGLNHDGVTVAFCVVAQHFMSLCDSDLYNGYGCKVYLSCE